jgi:predicted RNA-binding Zn-ribbon protein involved in translation (DUF1610 family)
VEKHCNHNIPETKKGAGPCDVRFEVKKRNGKPNWWCRTHGYEASAPDGAALDRCPGAWFEPVSEEMQAEFDVRDGVLAVWGVLPPAIAIGDVPSDPGKVHVHHRRESGGVKDVDRSFDIVRVTNGRTIEIIEGMAARAWSLSEVMGVVVSPLTCPHCGDVHIDELMFAARPHVKHQCNACGRNFRDRNPSVSNPLAGVHDRLGLPNPADPERPDRPLELIASDYRGIAIWPSNRAIVSTMAQGEDRGLHVHAWPINGDSMVDETYSSVVLDGLELDEGLVRVLTVQRALAQGAPIVSLACQACGHGVVSPTAQWMQPTTKHSCNACGAENRTRRRSFTNPLAEKSP